MFTADRRYGTPKCFDCLAEFGLGSFFVMRDNLLCNPFVASSYFKRSREYELIQLTEEGDKMKLQRHKKMKFPNKK